jgi:hypothetical protein
MVDLYLYSPLRLHDMMFNYSSTDINLRRRNLGVRQTELKDKCLSPQQTSRQTADRVSTASPQNKLHGFIGRATVEFCVSTRVPYGSESTADPRSKLGVGYCPCE